MAEASWGKSFVVKGEAEWQNVSGCLSLDEVSVCDEAMQTENRHREATFHVTQSSAALTASQQSLNPSRFTSQKTSM
jgi:hypothetical protein